MGSVESPFYIRFCDGVVLRSCYLPYRLAQDLFAAASEKGFVGSIEAAVALTLVDDGNERRKVLCYRKRFDQVTPAIRALFQFMRKTRPVVAHFNPSS
jgi:hypothetical protein